MARVVKKSEERKDELLEIAIRIFMEKGYENTSVKDIYAEASGSIGMFYHHFKSKEEIFEAAMDKYTDIFVEKIGVILLDEEIPFAKRYQQVLIHWMGLIYGRDKVRGTKHDEDVFRILSGKMLSGAIDPVRQYIDEGVKNGILKTNDSFQAAVILVYGIYGLINEERKRIQSNENVPQIFKGVSRLIALLLDADESFFSFEENEKVNE